MRIIYDNLIDADGVVLQADTEAIGRVIENVQDQRLGIRWRSTHYSAESVIIDLGSSQAVDVVAVMGHNLVSGSTVTVTANDDITTSGGVYTWVASGATTTETITWNADIMLRFTTSHTKRYWLFSIANDSGEEYSEVGRLWLGTYTDISPSSLISFNVGKERSDNRVYGKNRQKFSSVGVGWRTFDISFPQTAGTALTTIQTIYDTVGNHSSFIFCNFNTLREADGAKYKIVEPCYVSINGGIDFAHDKNMKFTYKLSLEEDK